MRDINTGEVNAGRDVNFIDQSGPPKFLVQCTAEELLDEEQHRHIVLSKEKSRRGIIFFRFLTFSGVLILFAIGWAYFQDAPNMVSMLSGAGGVLMVLANLKAMENPSRFEACQVAALGEISFILREQGTR